ncbi:MAG TPA: right-handed parallel beta-helix repeat-containing protein [Baekduia sp.]|nr:right-handed parallel beta-helix repeat-containing protein [Baekduia sp.]
MSSHRRSPVVALGFAVAALAAAGPAQAVNYPPPSKPGTGKGKPKGPHRTLRVCKHGHRCFPRIQDAINEARAGDRIKVAHGLWREGVSISGSGKRYIKLVGDPKHPDKVVLEGKGQKKANGVLINGADHVTVNGFTARHYRANGFFVTNTTGYRFTNLKAFLAGVYGVYAFNTRGGSITNSEAAWNSDSGFYIGQTPPQVKPIRSMVRNITSYGNVLGWSGTNMRYVTITKSKFYNNGAGIVPNALDSEKYPPAEDNVITGNEVFWNNFNYYDGAPFKAKPGGTRVGDVPFPIGVGILLFGGRGNTVTDNDVYGNWLVGIGALQALTLKDATARDLEGNQVTGNRLGLDGTDLNGRDLFYDGNGKDNCFGPNTGVQVVFPESGATMVPCPFTGANAFDQQALATAVDWTVGDATHEAHYIRHDHVSKPGITPLEHYTGGVK